MVALALAAGAFFGTLLRYETGKWAAPLSNGFPMGTLTINLFGCLFLGWFLTVTASRFRVPPSVRIGLGTGLTGSFTTFSTFSLEALNLSRDGHVGLAAAYVSLSIVGGIGCAAIGYAVAKIPPKRAKERNPA